jgi:DNA polymerase I-like protein with 3'-5' exonuclease and polymerase domains/5'-3' exonuclease
MPGMMVEINDGGNRMSRQKTMPALTVIDGSGFIYRAFHALPPLTTPEGISVGAVVGFANMVLRWQETHQPTHGVIVFDHGRSALRQEIFPDYKAHRPPTPPELAQQFPLIRQFCSAMHIPMVDNPGVEADDLIASIAGHVVAQGWSVDVVTSDKDLFQISGPNILMHDPLKHRTLDVAGVMDLWGVKPNQIPHVQALAGDSADGIPGIPGIGIKTATAWIQEFGSLQGLIDGVGQLKSIKKQALVTQYKDQALLCYQLALLRRTFWDNEWNPTDWTWTNRVDQCALSDFVNRFHLKTLAHRLHRRGILHPPSSRDSHFENPSACKDSNLSGHSHKVPSEESKPQNPSADSFSAATDLSPDSASVILESGPMFLPFIRNSQSKIDNTGTSFKPDSVPVSTVTFDADSTPGYNPSWVLQLPTISPPPDCSKSPDAILLDILEKGSVVLMVSQEDQWDWEKVQYVTACWGDSECAQLDQGTLWKIWQDDRCIKILHDAKKWMRFALFNSFSPLNSSLAGHGFSPAAIGAMDEAAADKQCGNEGKKADIGVNFSNLIHSSARDSAKPVKGLVGPIDDLMVMSYVLNGTSVKHDLISIFTHMGWSEEECALWTPAQKALAMRHTWERNLISLREKRLMRVYYTIDRPLISVLAKMEHRGIDMDLAGLENLEKTWEAEIQDLSQNIMDLAGQVFNPASPKQLGKVLFDDLGWPKGKKGKSGAYHTGSDVLTSFASKGYPLAKVLLEWRQLSKLVNTYARGLRGHIDSGDRRIHTTYSMVTTSTGRLSSLEPNLQNIPIRTERGRLLRHQFRAPAGYYFLCLDYSQIELRLLAHMGPVPSLQRAFGQHQDIHTQTAAHLFECSVAEVTPDMRRTAKGINFGILYGISAFGLAEHLGIDRISAKTMIQAYFATYPEMAEYLERTRCQARSQGYVATLWGRRCVISGAQNAHAGIRASAERQATNAPLQGTSADIIKRAMIAADAWIDQNKHYDVALVLQIHDELVFQVRCDQVHAVKSILVPLMENVAHLSVPLIVTGSFGETLDQ